MEPVLSSSLAPPQYNSQSIINTAEETLQKSGVNAAQTVYKSALLDWVDDVTMGDTIDKEAVRGEIANLWLAYADLNRRSNLVSDLWIYFLRYFYASLHSSIDCACQLRKEREDWEWNVLITCLILQKLLLLEQLTLFYIVLTQPNIIRT